MACGMAAWAAGAAAQGPEAGRTAIDWPSVNARALEESQQPIRPGVPGKTPFWNGEAKAFIYAPAFNFKKVEGASSYRFTARVSGPVVAACTSQVPAWSLADVWNSVPVGDFSVRIVGLNARDYPLRNAPQRRFFVRHAPDDPPPTIKAEAMTNAVRYACDIQKVSTLVFEADKPWAPLTPIWKNVPAGEVELTVEGLDAAGGAPVGRAGRTVFNRELPFQGPGIQPAMSYAEAARRSLKWSLKSPFIRQFQKPKQQYDLGRYPSKLTGSGAIRAATAYARLEPRPEDADAALELARHAARALIAASTPADAALPYVPLTYSPSVTNVPFSHPDRIMMDCPSGVGLVYLDLYDLTRDEEFFQAALRIAETYRKTQQPDGAWPAILLASSGKAYSNVPVVPARGFLKRLVEAYDRTEFQPAFEAAERYYREGPVKQFHAMGLFEDTSVRAGNLACITAAGMASYLFEHAEGPDDLATAEDMLRLAEDQFVLWHPPQPGTTSRSAPPNHLIPCALEQYSYRVPVTGSASSFMSACLAAYKATGKPLWLAKAVAMANMHVTLIERNGFIPTYNTDNTSDESWPNCPVGSAVALARFAGEMAKLGRPAGGAGHISR